MGNYLLQVTQNYINRFAVRSTRMQGHSLLRTKWLHRDRVCVGIVCATLATKTSFVTRT